MITKDFNKILNELQNGNVVGVPTETVYGLGAGIYFEDAIKRIYELKKRPQTNPLIVHVTSLEMINDLVEEIPENCERLIKKLAPGPISFLLKRKKDKVPDYITNHSNYVVVRIPDQPVFYKLIEKLNMPIAAPSANPYQMISPTSAKHVFKYFEDSFSIYDGGICKKGIESTIVGFENDKITILRKGSVTKWKIEKEFGNKITIVNQYQEYLPGTDKKHYSTKTPFKVVENWNEVQHYIKNKKTGIIAMNQPNIKTDFLSQSEIKIMKSTKEAMSKLYATMHYFDDKNLDLILCIKFPDDDHGQILNDKILRAVNFK